MKIFLIGFNASGKREVCDKLTSLGVRVGKNFRSIEDVPDNIYTNSRVVYSGEDIESIFENNAFVFFTNNTTNTESFFEGLSFFEYENNDVFEMTPDQFSKVPKFDDDVLFVWMDSNVSQRRNRHILEKRKYNFYNQEELENLDTQDFTTRINDYDYLYFVNEEPCRVSAIIYSLVKHPELIDLYKESFN